MSTCGVHRPPESTCATCRGAAAAVLLKNVSGLGPRTEMQLRALEDAVRQAAPWFTRAMCGERLQTLPNGMLASQTYARAARIADTCLTPALFETCVPSAADRAALRLEIQANGPAANIVHLFQGRDGIELVRARSRHNAHDKESLVVALRRAGVAGISRGVIAAEYETAYLDIETLVPSAAYATEHHAWHRSVAPKRMPGLLEAAQAAGLVGGQVL